MKKCLFICFAIISIILLAGCTQKESYSLKLPDKSNITEVVLILGEEKKSIKDKEDIDFLMSQLSSINKKSGESVNDTPQEEKYYTIEFETTDGTSGDTLYIYETANGCFAEQPYNGISSIDKEQYQAIINIFDK